MPGSITELVVFMASPSDLEDERNAVRAVVDEVNALLANMEIRFCVSGWENTLPNAGRPQGLINPEVERCDIFIGLLNRRWGSPTGEYSSGFEEEYTIAQARHDQTGDPSIHLFFADIPSEHLDDPGVSLRQVLAFRQKIITERRALFRPFEDSHDLARQVQALLMARAIAPLEAAAQSQSGSSSAESIPAAPSVEAVELDEAREQMSMVLLSFAAIIRGERGVDDHYDRDRVELIAQAFGRNQDALGAHFANRLFRRRDTLALSRGEGQLWLRSVLADIGRNEPVNRVIPGWCALLGETVNDLAELVDMAASDEPAVAVGAIRVLKEYSLRPAQLFDAHLTSGTPSVAAAENWVRVLNANPGLSEALGYFLESTDATDELYQLVHAAESLNEKSEALLSAVKAAAAGNPNELAANASIALVDDQRTAPLRAMVRDHLDSVHDDELRLLLRRADGSDLRVAATEAAVARGLLNPDEIEAAVDWGDEELLDRLVELAVAHPDTAEALRGESKTAKRAEFRAKLLARTTTRDDLFAIHHGAPWDNEAWEALLLNGGPDEVVEARTLIDTDGTELRELLGPHLGGRDDLIEFVVQEQMSVAGLFLVRRLSTTEDHPEGERAADLTRVIQASEAGHRLRRAAFIREVADAANLNSGSETELVDAWLRRIATDLYIHERQALFDTPLAPAIAKMATTSNEDDLKAAASRWIAGQPGTTDDELVELTYHPVSEVRMTAVLALIGRWEDARLRDLLDTYADRDREYWYNVIVALDAHLSALRSTK